VILSTRDFARRLGRKPERLRQIAAEIDENWELHYRFWSEVNSRTGKVRHFRDPRSELKEIQSKIKDLILSRIELSEAAHGGVRGKSPASNASLHLGRACVVTMDVKSFYPNVRHYVVYQMFRKELQFGREVAWLLTRLTTLRSELPQGAPTSTAVANILLTSAVDLPISRRARQRDIANTRFVDDIAFSGTNPTSLINDTARALSRRRLPVWRKNTKDPAKSKLKIMPRSQRQEVTGLVVNSSVSRRKRAAIRAAIFQLRNTPGETRERAVRSIHGRIGHVKAFNPGAAVRLARFLEERDRRSRDG
jgi:RNA-directed DNA polymerase